MLWKSREVICYGKFLRIRGEKLALIETIDKQKVEIKIGISGYIESLEVVEGQAIADQKLLITVRDDLLVTGSD